MNGSGKREEGRGKSEASLRSEAERERVGENSSSLAGDIRQIIGQSRSLAYRAVNSLQVLSNYLIGRRIVEEEQGGKVGAEYGKSLLKDISKSLTGEFGKGYSKSNLKYMRKFYLSYSSQVEGKSQTVSGKLADTKSNQKSQTVSGLFQVANNQLVSKAYDLVEFSKKVSEQFTLSWSHYIFLMGIKDEGERRFYEIEATNESWSLRELKRQFDSSLYERLALSRDKEELRQQLMDVERS